MARGRRRTRVGADRVPLALVRSALARCARHRPGTRDGGARRARCHGGRRVGRRRRRGVRRNSRLPPRQFHRVGRQKHRTAHPQQTEQEGVRNARGHLRTALAAEVAHAARDVRRESAEPQEQQEQTEHESAGQQVLTAVRGAQGRPDAEGQRADHTERQRSGDRAVAPQVADLRQSERAALRARSEGTGLPLDVVLHRYAPAQSEHREADVGQERQRAQQGRTVHVVLDRVHDEPHHRAERDHRAERPHRRAEGADRRGGAGSHAQPGGEVVALEDGEAHDERDRQRSEHREQRRRGDLDTVDVGLGEQSEDQHRHGDHEREPYGRLQSGAARAQHPGAQIQRGDEEQRHGERHQGERGAAHGVGRAEPVTEAGAGIRSETGAGAGIRSEVPSEGRSSFGGLDLEPAADPLEQHRERDPQPCDPADDDLVVLSVRGERESHAQDEQQPGREERCLRGLRPVAAQDPAGELPDGRGPGGRGREPRERAARRERAAGPGARAVGPSPLPEAAPARISCRSAPRPGTGNRSADSTRPWGLRDRGERGCE